MRVFRSFACAVIVGILCACSSSTAPMPARMPSPPSGGVPLTIDGFPVSITEYALPNSSPGNPVVGADGLVWFPAGQIQMDRISGTGAVSVFTATPPSGYPWTGFTESVSAGTAAYTEFLAPESSSMPELLGLYIARVSMSGVITQATAIGTDNDFPFAAMAADASGAFWTYIADYGANGRLDRFTWNGTGLTMTTGCGGIFGDVDGLAYGPDGNLYAAASVIGTPTIYKIAPSCAVLATFTPAVPSRVLKIVSGLDGALWMIFQGGTNVIGRLSTSGVYSQFSAPYASSKISAIAKGSDGAIWFTDEGTNAIGRLTTTGSFSEFPVPTPNAFSMPGHYVGGDTGGLISCPTACENAHGRIWFSENNASKIGRLEF